MDSPPDWIMPELSWSFSTEAPRDLDGFQQAVIEYNQEISELNVPDILVKSIGLDSVLVEFSYSVEEVGYSRPRNITWRKMDSTFVVESDDTSLTNAELLYKLHFGTREYFKDQSIFRPSDVDPFCFATKKWTFYYRSLHFTSLHFNLASILSSQPE